MSDRKSPFFDRRGVPICGGDLLKSYHFTDRRRKRHWLYHVAVPMDGHWEMIPTSHLDPSKLRDGGRCWLSQALADNAGVIEGSGPMGILSFDKRPRVRRDNASPQEATP